MRQKRDRGGAPGARPAMGFVLLIIAVLVGGAAADQVTFRDARIAAEYWIRHTEEKDGSWGGAHGASVDALREIREMDRVLGYVATVEPRGYIVISSLKELAPVKAFSVSSSIDIDGDLGMAPVIRSSLSRTLAGVEARFGPLEDLAAVDLGRVVERDHRCDWDRILRGEKIDYSTGQILLRSNWHQDPPYNEACPDMGCYPPYNGRAVVGCVGTAASQIMFYYCWPPYGHGDVCGDAYDWVSMRDTVSGASEEPIRAATAELCYEAGKAADTEYGCNTSSAWLGEAAGSDMTDAYINNFRYNSETDFETRWHWSTEGWYDMIKTNLDANRPLQYGYLGERDGGIAAHSMVCDGWYEAGQSRMVHMNYGWGDSYNDWYEIDDLHNVGWDEWEGLIRKIKPNVSEGSWIEAGSHDPSASEFPPYVYFEQDAYGDDAVYEAGYLAQFLPGRTVSCVSTTGGTIDFLGSSASATLLFSRGDLSKGIRIRGGALRVHPNGFMKVH
ncbi:MAG: C10 family peptidase [Candidatus Eisenbacteria bacterium]